MKKIQDSSTTAEKKEKIGNPLDDQKRYHQKHLCSTNLQK